MGFSPMKFKPESGANRIKSADDAYSFMVHMRLSYQNKPHWQVARQPSTMLAHQMRAKFRHGGPFGRRLSQKAGFWIREAPRSTWGNAVLPWIDRPENLPKLSSLRITQPRWTENLLRSTEFPTVCSCGVSPNSSARD